MAPINLLTPNEVAALAQTPANVVEKVLEQKVFGAEGLARKKRLLPLHAVAVAVTSKVLGRRLSVDDKRRMARHLARLTSTALKTAEVEVAPSVVIHVGTLARDAVERAERYVKARDFFIESVEGVMGGRPVIRGTQLTVAAIYDRLTRGDTVDDLIEDYPDIPREAFEVSYLYGKTHPQVGRPAIQP